jgi:hypothetical protein
MALASIRAAFGRQRGQQPESDSQPVYHRFADRDEVERVKRSGELWGKPPRNIYQSDIPCVKAYAGPLRGYGDGFEFITEVVPRYSSQYERRWVAGMPGVRVEGNLAKIPVTVTRIRIGGP